LEDKFENARLVPRTLLFGRVVAYNCTACGKDFAVRLLEEAVSSDLPTPLSVYAAFLEHECKGSDPRGRRPKYEKGISMAAEDEDLPTKYLLYAGAVILIIATVGIIALLFLFHR
jgi:hypothetical protein